MKKILITGSAGFIGFNLHNYLSNYFDVMGCDNLSSISKKTQKLRLNQIKKKKLKFVKLNLNNLSEIKKKLNKYKFDLIIHLAAQPGVRISQLKPQKTMQNNVTSFINIYEFAKAKKIKNVFFASSSSVYGNSKFFSEDKSALNPNSVYAVSKITNEYLAQVYHKLYGINSLGLRFFTVYGPWGREDMSYYKFLKDINKYNKIKIFGDKYSRRSFTFINDVNVTIKKLINFYKKKKTYLNLLNIGNKSSRSLEELIDIIQKKFKFKFEEKIQPRNISDSFITISNNKKIFKLIKYYPNTKLEKGINKFFCWYESNII